MKRKTILFGILISFLAGVFLFDALRDDRLFLIPIISFVGIFFPKIRPQILIFWNGAFLVGMLRVFFAISSPASDDIAFYARDEEFASEVQLVGTVQNFPDVRADKILVYVQTESFQHQEKERPIFGKVLVNLSPLAEVSYGDVLKINGKLTIPPVWEDFSYRRYLEKEGIYAYFPKAQFEKSGSTGNPLFRTLFSLRQKMDTTLRDRIPEPSASFAVGILLGGERGFSEGLISTFQKTGLSHLLALSGFNITILIFFVFWIFRFFPKPVKLILTICCIAAFVLLTGASASVVRAAVMGLLALLVLHFGQETDPLYVLFWSIFLIVLGNPFLLRSDVSFQLSIGGVLGLVLLTPLWQKVFSKLPSFGGVNESLQTTLAAQIMTVPLIVFYFGRLSLISPLANILVAPLIPFAMLCSFLALFPLIGPLAAFAAYGLLSLALWITSALSKIPFADIAADLSLAGMLIWYLIWIGLWQFLRRRHQRKI